MWTVYLNAEGNDGSTRSAQFGIYGSEAEALEVSVKSEQTIDDRYGDLGKIGILFDIEPRPLSDALTWTHAVVTELLGWEPELNDTASEDDLSAP